MNAVIVDDEATVRNTIRTLLSENFPDIKVLASAGTIGEGYEAIIQYKPDLLFLDIELPDGSGFDLLRKFTSVSFKIIFVTGHQEYALDAIKVSALDYILKPIDNDELLLAVEKAREVISHTEQQLKLQALNENLQSRKVLKRIILHTSDHLQLISVSDIIRAEADSNYTRFWLSGGQRIMVSRTIKEFAGLLSGSGIIRVHQSHLVNLSYIDKFVKKGGGYLQLKDNTTIPVSPNLKKQVLQALTDHLYE
ncbi:MAG: LytTR family DNA-binding domain-containing protein [Bacteroidales bacterium]|nr:LytTR family DNA-binding domain-containing protein [Bacteroidales bacterium]